MGTPGLSPGSVEEPSWEAPLDAGDNWFLSQGDNDAIYKHRPDLATRGVAVRHAPMVPARAARSRTTGPPDFATRVTRHARRRVSSDTPSASV